MSRGLVSYINRTAQDRARLDAAPEMTSGARGPIVTNFRSDLRPAKAALGMLRARFLGSASSFAIPAASIVLALGVSLSSEASAQTSINPQQTTTYNLQSGNNPPPFGPQTTIVTTITDAVDGGTNINPATNQSVAWTVINYGTLNGGGKSNSGSANGVFLQATNSTVTNYGSIAGNGVGSSGTIGQGAIVLTAGGTVINTVTNTGAVGNISGAKYGINILGGAGTVTNSGTITGGTVTSNGNGIRLGSGGYVLNQKGGVITQASNANSPAGGNTPGAVYSFGITTVTNHGAIGGYVHSGIVLIAQLAIAKGGGTVTNYGTISGKHYGVLITTQSYYSGITPKFASNTTVTNSGYIQTTGPGGIGINAFGALGPMSNAFDSKNSSSITNSGTINASTQGIKGGSVYSSIMNSGSVTATGTTGIGVGFSSGILTNGSTNNNHGYIYGGQTGVGFSGTSTISNFGTIKGGSYGIQSTYSYSGATVTITNSNMIKGVTGPGVQLVFFGSNSASISNLGAITGGTIGIQTSFYAGGFSTITNSGTITGGTTGIQVSFYGNGSTFITNSGTISGTGTVSGTGSGTQINVTGNTFATASANYAATTNAVVTNTGTIIGTGTGQGVGILNQVTALASANNTANATTTVNSTITNFGMIAGSTTGISTNVTATPTVANTASAGVNARAIANNTITNFGVISGGMIGISINVSATAIAAAGTTATAIATSTATNFGVISGITGPGISSSAGTGTYGTIINYGRISGGGATNPSIQLTGGGTQTLILQTGSILIGDAIGNNTAATTSAPAIISHLVLQGTGTGIANNNFANFTDLFVSAGSMWALNGTNNSIATTNVAGTLGGSGTITGTVNVMGGGTLAPGVATPFTTLHITGNATFASGSIYQVNINAAGQNDKTVLTGTATLSGGLVQVLSQDKSFTPGMQYTILTAKSLNNTTFAGVTTNLAFLSPSLSYTPTDVVLSFTQRAQFEDVAKTYNEHNVGAALDASPSSSPLVKAILNLTATEAVHAYDQLSGEIYADAHTTQIEETQYMRNAMLGRMRQASYSSENSELSALTFGGPELAYAGGGTTNDPNFLGKAPIQGALSGGAKPSRELTFWSQGLGGFGHIDGDGNAAKLTGTFGGFLAGADARFGDTLRAGFAAGYVHSSVNVAARASGAGIDSAQLGLYAGGTAGALSLRAGASYTFDTIDTNRTVVFPGFFDQTHAHFNGNAGQIFGEAGYGMAFNHIAVEPFAGLAYVSVRTDAFQETGGAAALSASGAGENIGYSSLGVRAATIVPLANGTALAPRISAQWQHAYGEVTPGFALTFQNTGVAFALAGVPIARDAALLETGLDWRFTPFMKFGVSYQGELADHAQIHSFEGAFTWNF